MGKVDVSQAICQAIDIIVDKKLAGAGFNKTIQAKVVKVLDSEKGKYQIQYQDNRSNAYSLNNSVIYSPQEPVLVLLPSNNWDQDKIIISGLNSFDNDEQENIQGYSIIGQTIIYTPGQQITTIGLSSYDYTTQSGEMIQIDSQTITVPINGELNQKLKRYISQSANGVVLSAYIRTDFDNDRFENLGIYGINYTVRFNNPQTGNYTKVYTLDTRNVIGQPYLLNNAELVSNVINDFNAEEFVGVQSITAYVKGFTPDPNKRDKNDVFISNIGICAANVMSEEESKGFNLWLNYPNGTQINSRTNTVTVKADLKRDGRSINDNVSFRWYRENAAVRYGDLLADTYAGDGWECLSLKAGVPAGFQENDFSFTNNQTSSPRQAQITAKKTRIKCIAVYKQTKQYQALVDIYYESGLDTIIDSFDKVNGINQQIYYNYVYNNSNPIKLKCLLKNGQSQIDQDGSLYYYYWSVDASGYNYTTQGKTLTFGSVSNNFTNLSQATFTCTVYTKVQNPQTGITQRGNYIGTIGITLINRKGISDQFSVMIYNGDKIIQYYDDGQLAVGDQGLVFTPLQLKFFDPDGHQIDLSSNSKIQQIIWSVPAKNSIIQINTSSYMPPTSALIPDPAGAQVDVNRNGFYHFKDITSLSYAIASTYQPANINNTINVYISYVNNNGQTNIFRGSTSFLVVKAGDPGTNGTDTIASIIPYDSGGNPIATRRIYLQSDSSNLAYYKRRYTDSINKQFLNLKFQLSQNNIPISVTPSKIKWELPIQKLQNYNSCFRPSATSGQAIQISRRNDNFPSSISEITDSYSNILRSTYNINNLTYYSELPACYVYTTDSTNRLIKLKNDSGYTFVKYSQSGRNPKYDYDNNFVVQVYEKVNNSWNLVQSNLTYTWLVRGNLDKISSSGNTIIVEPKSEYNGVDLTSAIGCTVSRSGSQIGFIYIPIYTYINRYNHRYLNSWDGNSIQIGTNGQRILAPEIGAGIKEGSNGFTGVLMGQVTQTGNNDSQVGLFAYSQGARTIFLNAKNGVGYFGQTGTGQIEINGTKAVITGGSYSQTGSGSGMQIDLADPHIKYGNGKFIVDKNGILTATDVDLTGNIYADSGYFKGELQGATGSFSGSIIANNGHIGGWQINQQNLATKSGNIFLRSTDGTSATTRVIEVIQNNESKFYVQANGLLFAKNADIEGKITADQGRIGGWNITTSQLNSEDTANNSLVYINANPARRSGIFLRAGNTASGTQKFQVAHDGTLTAKKGTIGGWDITDSQLSTKPDSNNNNNIFLRSTNGSAATAKVIEVKDSNESKFYVQANGLLFAKNADIEGKITATSGKIGSWQINSKYISGSSDTDSVYINCDSTAVGGNFLRAGSKSTPTFIVKMDGRLSATNADIKGTITATGGTIGGWTINQDMLSTRSGRVILSKATADSTKVIQVKNSSGTETFSLTAAGKLTATNADIKGKITATSGSFKGEISATSGTLDSLTIKNCTIENNCTIKGNISANQISGTLKATTIAAKDTSGSPVTTDVKWRTIRIVTGTQISKTGTSIRLMQNYTTATMLVGASYVIGGKEVGTWTSAS